ncbi:MAG: hypothetical protein LBH37_00935 [Oscillospiraceae bacterium]|nr:hypothetical protein [Oscillospiraceae bacterium]
MDIRVWAIFTLRTCKLQKKKTRNNREISKKRIFVENTIGFMKRFKIISDKCKKTDKKVWLEI